MYVRFELLLLVVLNVSVKQSTGSWSAVVTDLTAADKYDEKIHSQIITKIKGTDFETLVSRISSRHQIPAKIQEAILDGKYNGEVNQAVVREFKFEKGAPGKILYGRTVTIKREDSTIDLAYVFFSLEFYIVPKKN